MSQKILVVIPARYASTRLPGKPLLPLAGKPMIQHVYERASSAKVSQVLVATDDQRIFDAVTDFGGEVVLTSPNHLSGTDRVAEAARSVQADLIINVQGDEPLLDPDSINRAVAPLLADDTIEMGTLAHALTDAKELLNPNVVKVVINNRGFALYFSRAPIPFDRDQFTGQPPTNPPTQTPSGVLRHIGLYVYRADFLQKFAQLSPTKLEKKESLEQLRALEHGHDIRVVTVTRPIIGVDTPEDVEKVRIILEQSQS
ncbi:MAG: 3-deoxy-manno-octulosonate cytidylyltransferase [Magnetococcales bacterium]|nr:3-deoxy-manno-octulosonate cytidylyltransferase [Magnetococcales bacterium]